MPSLCRMLNSYNLQCQVIKSSVFGMTFVLLLFSAALAKDQSETQVNSLGELVTMFDSSSCKECHEQIYAQWEKSHHARSLMGLNDQIFIAGYLKKGPFAVKPGEKAAKSNFPCFKCHFPQIKYGTDAVAAEISDAVLKDDKSTVRKLNIGCLVCHNEKAVVHGRPEKHVIYGNKDIKDHPGLPVKKSPLLKNSLMCGQCHGLGPNLEFEHPVQCATLFGSYLHAYIPSGGTETCQECHMRDGDHYMPPNFNNRAELSERLRESLPMQVRTLAYSFQPKEGDVRPMVVVNTKITSKAGHRIPDG